MDALFAMAGSSLCWLFVVGLIYAIVTPKVDDRIVVKIGMILAAAGFTVMGWKMWSGISPWEVIGVERAILMTNGGALIVVVGYLTRTRRRGHSMRRQTDWAALQDTRPMTDAELRHASGGASSKSV